MAVIGFRCFPNDLSFVVLEGTQQNPHVIAHEKFSFPRDYNWGEKLSWLRRQIIELLGEFNLSSASLKTIEPRAQQISVKRVQAEGVVLEASNSTLNRECTCRIKSQIRRDIQDFTQAARYLDRALTSRGFDELNNANFKDAAFVALAELSSQN